MCAAVSEARIKLPLVHVLSANVYNADFFGTYLSIRKSQYEGQNLLSVSSMRNDI